MKPMLLYYGGKQRIARYILRVIDTIPHTVYVEPFAGGAAVLFAKPRRYVGNDGHYREVLNDTNGDIIILYRVCQDDYDALLHKISFTPYSKAEHRRALAIIKDSDNTTPLDRAWATVVSTRQAFANKLRGGWGRNRIGQNSAMVWANYQDALPMIMQRLRGVYLDCMDAIDCIRRWDSPTTLFYCDPPYPGTDQGHYDGYTIDDYQRLCDALDGCQGSYILSNYPQDIEPRTAQERLSIEAFSGAAKSIESRGQRSEVLWVRNRSDYDMQQGSFL